MAKFIADEIIKGKTKLELATYEDCEFVDCNFSEAGFSGFNFADCVFKNCDLSLAQLGGTGLRNVTFEDCKMVGLRFDHCNEMLFAIHCSHCQLNVSSFYERNLKSSSFKNCRLIEVDFAEANLSGITIDNCDLSGAMFDHTNLEKADLRNSFNFTIDPENNRLKNAYFSSSDLIGLLRKYRIKVE